MSDWSGAIALFGGLAAWALLQYVVFPRLGVPT